MHVQNETQLTEFQQRSVRVRPATAQPARLLLLLHGWTGDENSMWVFARDLPPDYWIIAPRAPYPTQPGGYSWRPDQTGEHDRPTFAHLRPAAEALISFVDAYAGQNGLAAAQFDAMGFSQGGALLATLSVLFPDRLRRVAILAGFLPEGAEQHIKGQPLAGKPVFVAHGSQDDHVPLALARRSVEILERAGAQVTYCEDDVGHKVSLDCLHALQRFLA